MVVWRNSPCLLFQDLEGIFFWSQKEAEKGKGKVEAKELKRGGMKAVLRREERLEERGRSKKTVAKKANQVDSWFFLKMKFLIYLFGKFAAYGLGLDFIFSYVGLYVLLEGPQSLPLSIFFFFGITNGICHFYQFVMQIADESPFSKLFFQSLQSKFVEANF